MERPGSRNNSRSGRRAATSGAARPGRRGVGPGDAAAGVQELQPHAGGGLHLGDDVERRGDRLPVRLHTRDLGADVQVHPRRLQAGVPGRQPKRRDGVVAVDAGLATVCGLEAGMRERRHVHVDARGHGGHPVHGGGDFADPAQLVHGVDHEGAHADGDPTLDLGLGLGDAVEHDLPRPEPGGQRLVQLPAGVDLDVRTGVSRHAQEPQVGAGLAGVEDLGGRMHAAERPDHRLHIGAQATLAEHEERRLARLRQSDEVLIVEAQMSVTHGVQRVGGCHTLPACRVGAQRSILRPLCPTGYGRR
jgi:hypothetical protein